MKLQKNMLPYLAVITAAFYLLPFLIQDTGTAMLVLLVLVPAICFICSMVYGIKHAFSLMYVILVTLLFIPTIFIFYNSSAWVYIFHYGIAALVGNGLGTLFYKNR